MDMDDRRTRPRWQASFFFAGDKKYDKMYFDVIDLKTKKSLGHLIDLTIDGLQIISKAKIPKGKLITMRIELPEEVHETREIYITAESVWNRQDENPEIFYTGFKIVTITPPYGEVIDMLIQ